MSQLADLPDEQLWNTAAKELSVQDAEDAARILGALLPGQQELAEVGWYVAPGCDPALYLGHIAEHAAVNGESA